MLWFVSDESTLGGFNREGGFKPEGQYLIVQTWVRFILVGVVITCGSSLSMAQSAADSVLACEGLTATGNPEYPPYLWQSPDNPRRLIGANALIMEEVSKRLGVPIDLVYVGPWSRSQEEVRAGRIDLMAGAFFTLPRVEYMDYVQPAFLTTRSVVWSRQLTEFDYQGRDDLQSLRGATVINNSFGQVFDQYMRQNLQIESVSSLEQAFRMLAQNRVDYVLYEDFPGRAYAARLGLDRQLRSLEPPVSEESLFLGISHRSQCNNGHLRGRLTQIMTELEREGFNQAALERGLALWREQNPTD
ncbi:MAG: substrate-binding periplasmic protein [Saccharospirillum sp.]